MLNFFGKGFSNRREDSPPSKNEFYVHGNGGVGLWGGFFLSIIVAISGMESHILFSGALIAGLVYEISVFLRDVYTKNLYFARTSWIGRYLIVLGGWLSAKPAGMLCLFALVWIASFAFIGLYEFGSGLFEASIKPEPFGRFVLWSLLLYVLYFVWNFLVEIFKSHVKEDVVNKFR